MKVAVIGSRDLSEIDIEKYIPDDVSEIVSGGARGIDTLAKEYAMKKKILYTEFLPQYSRYGRAAPIRRNQEIAEYADMAIAFWNGESKGTEYAIRLFQRLGKRVTVIRVEIVCG